MQKLAERLVWRRAHNYLQKHKPALIGVSGSRGKALVRNALQLALFGHSVRTTMADSRQRSDIALTILGAKPPQANRLDLLGSIITSLKTQPPDTVILELSADQPGDIDFFSRALPLNIAVVTNVHSRHLHLFNNLDLLAHEQTSLVANLESRHIACLNHDDPRVAGMSQHTAAKIIWFGTSHGNDVRLVRASRLASFGLACEFNIRGRPLEINLPNIIDPQQLTSIAAALAATLALGGDIKTAANSFSKIEASPGQLNILSGRHNAKIIDDSFDSTPESLLAALHNLAGLPGRRRLAILGDLTHLGAYTVNWHEEIGRAAALSADVIIAVGESMRIAGAAALDFAQERQHSVDVHHFSNSAEVGKWLPEFIRPEDLVYVAGSADLKMGKVVKAIKLDS